MSVTYKGDLPALDRTVTITAGIHAEEGSESHGELSNAEIGEIHELGLGVPQRSWLRAYFDEHEQEIQTLIDNEIVSAMLDGTDLASAADRVAVAIQGGIKERIYSRIPPELSKAVKAKRGESAVALIDSGQFINAIRAMVVIE
jgi:hypothetical protein